VWLRKLDARKSLRGPPLEPGLTGLALSVMFHRTRRGSMKLRPILTIIAVLGVAALLFLPADIRAASLPDDSDLYPTGWWTSAGCQLPAKPK
jgi:hypothetical protein